MRETAKSASDSSLFPSLSLTHNACNHGTKVDTLSRTHLHMILLRNENDNSLMETISSSSRIKK